MNSHRQRNFKKAEKKTQPFFIGDSLKLKIDRLSFNGGRGVGRSDSGFVVFVENTAPGDVVEVVIEKVKKSFAEAKLVRVISSGASRIQSPCPVSNDCGGCCWQHIDYQTQLTQKVEILKKQLNPISHLIEGPEIKILPSPKPLRYRNRIQLHKKNDFFGFYKRGTHQLIPIQDCLIAEEKLMDFWRSQVNSLGDGRYEIFIDSVTQEAQIKIDEKNHQTNRFQQVNTGMNQQLIDQVVKSVDGSLPIFDFYCGSGNFSFPLAEAYPRLKIIGVELSQVLVEMANERLKELNLDNLSFTHSSAEEGLTRLTNAPVNLLVDPPREGLSAQFRSQLKKYEIRKLIYVSCNPSTLARDLSEIGPELNLRVKSLLSYDMFPQTDHMEVLAVLTR